MRAIIAILLLLCVIAGGLSSGWVWIALGVYLWPVLLGVSVVMVAALLVIFDCV